MATSSAFGPARARAAGRKQQRAQARRADGEGTGRRAVRPFATPKCGSSVVSSSWPSFPAAPEHPPRKPPLLSRATKGRFAMPPVPKAKPKPKTYVVKLEICASTTTQLHHHDGTNTVGDVEVFEADFCDAKGNVYSSEGGIWTLVRLPNVWHAAVVHKWPKGDLTVHLLQDFDDPEQAVSLRDHGRHRRLPGRLRPDRVRLGAGHHVPLLDPLTNGPNIGRRRLVAVGSRRAATGPQPPHPRGRNGRAARRTRKLPPGRPCIRCEGSRSAADRCSAGSQPRPTHDAPRERRCSF
jgi:hypothetical protein